MGIQVKFKMGCGHSKYENEDLLHIHEGCNECRKYRCKTVRHTHSDCSLCDEINRRGGLPPKIHNPTPDESTTKSSSIMGQSPLHIKPRSSSASKIPPNSESKTNRSPKPIGQKF